MTTTTATKNQRRVGYRVFRALTASRLGFIRQLILALRSTKFSVQHLGSFGYDRGTLLLLNGQYLTRQDFGLTEQGAKRLADLYSDSMLYGHDIATWLEARLVTALNDPQTNPSGLTY
jgi:hypothetical protein